MGGHRDCYQQNGGWAESWHIISCTVGCTRARANLEFEVFDLVVHDPGLFDGDLAVGLVGVPGRGADVDVHRLVLLGSNIS